MRVLVLCPSPESASSEAGSAAAILEELGCRVVAARLDLDDLDDAEITAFRPNLIVVDAEEDMGLANRCRRSLGLYEALSEIPTLLVTAVPRLASLDFTAGFDDFVLSPVVPAELYARLRQLDWKSAAFGSDEVIKNGELVIDVAGYEAKLGGRVLQFTHQEFELLKFLAENRGRVFSREQLLQRVWGYRYGGGTRTVDIHVRRVRAKLGASASSMIVTVRNVGYKMA